MQELPGDPEGVCIVGGFAARTEAGRKSLRICLGGLPKTPHGRLIAFQPPMRHYSLDAREIG